MTARIGNLAVVGVEGARKRRGERGRVPNSLSRPSTNVSRRRKETRCEGESAAGFLFISVTRTSRRFDEVVMQVGRRPRPKVDSVQYGSGSDRI